MAGSSYRDTWPSRRATRLAVCDREVRWADRGTQPGSVPWDSAKTVTCSRCPMGPSNPAGHVLAPGPWDASPRRVPGAPRRPPRTSPEKGCLDVLGPERRRHVPGLETPPTGPLITGAFGVLRPVGQQDKATVFAWGPMGRGTVSTSPTSRSPMGRSSKTDPGTSPRRPWAGWLTSRGRSWRRVRSVTSRVGLGGASGR